MGYAETTTVWGRSPRRPGATAVLALMLGLVLAGSGCDERDAGPVAVPADVAFAIKPGRTTVTAGDTATFSVESQNTLGRDPRVEWSCSNGAKITTSDESRVARVTFKDPGTYMVQAKLYFGNQLVRTDSIAITVRPVP